MRPGTCARAATGCVLAAVLVVSTLAGGSAHAGAKPERQVSAKIVEVTDQDLAFKGKVFGSRERPYDNRVTHLQKKTCRSCSWQVIRTNRTNDQTRYTYDVGAPRRGKWFFRAQVPETREYRTSYSRVWYTERT